MICLQPATREMNKKAKLKVMEAKEDAYEQLCINLQKNSAKKEVLS